MKNSFAILIAALVVLVLLVNMFCFQVRYDEVAVVTTFQKADDTSVRDEPRLYFRLPPPIQSVTKYPKRLHLLETKIEESSVSDQNNVALSVYVTWQISNPLEFYRNFKTIARAQENIEAKTRNAQAIVTQYKLEDLVNVDPTQVKMAKMEEEITKALAAELANEGVAIKKVGVRRIMLPDPVTPAVFKRMIGDREKLAQAMRSAGTARAKSIVSEAERIRDSMMTHAERYARAERARGDEMAAAQYTVFAQNPELANFLKRLESIPKMIGEGSTLILNANMLDMQPPTAKQPVPVRDEPVIVVGEQD